MSNRTVSYTDLPQFFQRKNAELLFTVKQTFLIPAIVPCLISQHRFAERIESVLFAIVAVSYTHLDVYKRQVQTPLCGARTGEARTLRDYLNDAAVTERAGIDARWAVVCLSLIHI